MMSGVDISSIEIPDDLPEVEKSEYLIYQELMKEIEDEWLQIDNKTHPEFIKLLKTIEENKKIKTKQSEERYNARMKVIEDQSNLEIKKIEEETEDFKRNLFDRLIKAFAQSRDAILNQLKKELGPKEYSNFIQNNTINLPSIPTENQIRTRTQNIDDIKPHLRGSEIESDLKKIKSRSQAGQKI